MDFALDVYQICSDFKWKMYIWTELYIYIYILFEKYLEKNGWKVQSMYIFDIKTCFNKIIVCLCKSEFYSTNSWLILLSYTLKVKHYDHTIDVKLSSNLLTMSSKTC